MEEIGASGSLTSSSMSRSGSIKSAPAKATLIRHPPDSESVGQCCIASVKRRPLRIDAARASAVAQPMASIR